LKDGRNVACSLRETATKQPSQEQLLPFCHSSIRREQPADRNRAYRVHRLRGKGQRTGGSANKEWHSVPPVTTVSERQQVRAGHFHPHDRLGYQAGDRVRGPGQEPGDVPRVVDPRGDVQQMLR